MLQIKGTVVYNDFEGGFWGIKGDDGKKYCPLELPIRFQQKGCRVVADVERVSVMSLRMWGTNVEIKQIQLEKMPESTQPSNRSDSSGEDNKDR